MRAGEGVLEAIRYFGEQGRIFYVHFRDVRGTRENFSETFHDNGPTDMVAAMRAYREIGFDGPVSIAADASQFASRNREAIVQRTRDILEEQWSAAGLNAAGKLVPASVES